MRHYLEPTRFIDSDHAQIRDFARDAAAGAENPVTLAVRLHDAVRDEIRYDPYGIGRTRASFRASRCLETRRGFCITKAVLLAACARASGIPARLGFADVRNHLSTEKLRRRMQTDLFVFHGYTELHLDGRWVKATPAFNADLCERFGQPVLRFDGRTDSLFQALDLAGNRFMEYVADRGTHADLPFGAIMAAFAETYGEQVFGAGETEGAARFEAEAARERQGAA